LENPLEKHIQQQILQYLEIRGIFHWRNNTGAVKTDERFFRFGLKGSSDIIGVLPGGRALFIEVKRPSGRLTAPQKEFLGRASMAGALAFEAKSVEEVDQKIREAMK
jgi:hypothetical protein